MLDYRKLVGTKEDVKQLEKLVRIQNRVTRISKKIKDTNEPIFIELIGTPKSGKTTLKGYLQNLFENNGIDCFCRRETAEYNPVDKSLTDYYNIWMILELCKNLSEDLSKKEGKIIIYDRGILDRLPWMKMSVEKGTMSEDTYNKLLKLFEVDVLNRYNPIAEIFKTSPELSVQRKGRPGRSVNIESITTFNKMLDETIPDIRKRVRYSSVIETDPYQGYMQRFITDNVDDILKGIEQEIEMKITEQIR